MSEEKQIKKMVNANIIHKREGVWIIIGEPEWRDGVREIPVECSVCSIRRYIPAVSQHGYYYCPNCGAKIKAVI